MISTEEWKMPHPNVGDVVLFSKDYQNFSDPCVGFVVKEAGSSTITILTFTETGYSMVYNSCHHRSDPALKGDHGWQDLGVWDFAPITATLRELTAEPTSVRKSVK
jgi:hypothetical protein